MTRGNVFQGHKRMLWKKYWSSGLSSAHTIFVWDALTICFLCLSPCSIVRVDVLFFYIPTLTNAPCILHRGSVRYIQEKSVPTYFLSQILSHLISWRRMVERHAKKSKPTTFTGGDTIQEGVFYFTLPFLSSFGKNFEARGQTWRGGHV